MYVYAVGISASEFLRVIHPCHTYVNPIWDCHPFAGLIHWNAHPLGQNLHNYIRIVITSGMGQLYNCVHS